MPFYEPPLSYLATYVFELAELCKDAIVSFRILEQAISQEYQRPPRMHDDTIDMQKMENYRANTKYAHTLGRVGLHSFIISAANIRNIICPSILKIDSQISKDQKKKRTDELVKFFPSDLYPNLRVKNFRNYLEHFDERLDTIHSTNPNANLVSWTGPPSSLPTGSFVLLNCFDYMTFKIIYYDKEKGRDTADIRAMYEEVDKIRLRIPEALAEIRGTPSDIYYRLIEIG